MSHRLSLFVVALGALPLLAGCGRSKLTQCAVLFENINAGGTEMSKLVEPTDKASAAAYAEGIQRTLGPITKVELEDPKLKELRDTYVKSVGDLGAGMKASFDAEGEAKIPQLEKVKAARDESLKTIDSITSYCK